MRAGGLSFIMRPWRWLLPALLLVAITVACRPDPLKRVPIVVASADTPEQLLLGQMAILALDDAGYRVIDKTALGSTQAVRAALGAGSVDVAWEYTGDTWAIHLGHDRPIANPEELFRQVSQADALNGISWVAVTRCHRRMGVILTKQTARAKRLQSVGDLANHALRVDPEISLCVERASYDASSGIRGLETVYTMRFKPTLVRFTSTEESYRMLLSGECTCLLGLSTDVASNDKLVMLGDERAFFPASNLAVAVRTPILREFPGVETRLREISQRLDQASLAELRRRVASKGEKPRSVAARFLTEQRLIGRNRADGSE